jgi:hypothetical protein
MAGVKDNSDGRFLHAEDLLRDGEWKQYTLTIAEVIPPGFKYANGQTCEQYILKFAEGSGKMFSLSAKCNRRIMPYATGTSDPDNWVGKKITVYAARGTWFKEDNLAAVRIRPQPGAKPKLNIKDVGVDLTGTKVMPVAEGGTK